MQKKDEATPQSKIESSAIMPGNGRHCAESGITSGRIVILTENFHMMMGIGTAGSDDEVRRKERKRERRGERKEAEKFQVWR